MALKVKGAESGQPDYCQAVWHNSCFFLFPCCLWPKVELQTSESLVLYSLLLHQGPPPPRGLHITKFPRTLFPLLQLFSALTTPTFFLKDVVHLSRVTWVPVKVPNFGLTADLLYWYLWGQDPGFCMINSQCENYFFMPQLLSSNK